MDFLAHYGLFLLKTVTFVVAILITALGVVAISSKGGSKEKLTIKKLNKKFEHMADAINKETLTKKALKQKHKAKKRADKKAREEKRRRIFVLHFNGDIRASAVHTLRDEITALLTVSTPEDEVVVTIESGGGMVHAYGLAASQLQRIRDKHIPLTVCIDKVAASGGYLMACVANQILAAPFALVGSIGVLAQLPNLHRFLRKKDIDFEQITAGKYKRTLTVFGENTKEARAKMHEDLEEIHDHFKAHLTAHRPHVNIDTVATGEHWLGERALDLQLVDRLITSDDYLLTASNTADIYTLTYRRKKTFVEKLGRVVQSTIDKTVELVSG